MRESRHHRGPCEDPVFVFVLGGAFNSELAWHVTASLHDRTLYEPLPASGMRRDAPRILDQSAPNYRLTLLLPFTQLHRHHVRTNFFSCTPRSPHTFPNRNPKIAPLFSTSPPPFSNFIIVRGSRLKKTIPSICGGCYLKLPS